MYYLYLATDQRLIFKKKKMFDNKLLYFPPKKLLVNFSTFGPETGWMVFLADIG